MTVSMAIVPLLKDDAARSFMRTLESSSLRPYTEEQRTKTYEKVKDIIVKRKYRSEKHDNNTEESISQNGKNIDFGK